MRGGYALARRPYLVGLYDSWLRTMDEAFEIIQSENIRQHRRGQKLIGRLARADNGEVRP